MAIHIEQRSVFTQLNTYVQVVSAAVVSVAIVSVAVVSLAIVSLAIVSEGDHQRNTHVLQAGLAAALKRSAADEQRKAQLRGAASAKAALAAAVHGVSAADLTALHTLGGELLNSYALGVVECAQLLLRGASSLGFADEPLAFVADHAALLQALMAADAARVAPSALQIVLLRLGTPQLSGPAVARECAAAAGLHEWVRAMAAVAEGFAAVAAAAGGEAASGAAGGAAGKREARLPLVLLGPPGSGKSASLANWFLKNKRPGFVLAHFVGCSANSAGDHVSILRRILAELQRAFHLGGEVT